MVKYRLILSLIQLKIKVAMARNVFWRWYICGRKQCYDMFCEGSDGKFRVLKVYGEDEDDYDDEVVIGSDFA